MSNDNPNPLDYRDATAPRYSPRQMTTVGVWLFLASLSMLFAASLLGYVLIRLSSASHPVPGHNLVPLGALRFPPELWGSTVLVIGVSVALWRAMHAVSLERQQPFRRWLLAALVLAAGFIAVQTPAMLQLINEHKALKGSSTGTALYGLIFVLVLLHALHVIGGIIALLPVVIRGMRGRYDHEHYAPVRHATMYWHFLDVVWLVMFSTFLLTR